ncbi:MAG: VanZ family protein [bacterium]|nr:VanZ family protein [bacterium]
MLFIGLYPFNYFSPNQVSVNEDGSGLHFHGRGIAYSTGDSAWPEDGNSDSPLTLELMLNPERSYNRGIPHILSLCDVSGREVMYLGQWKSSLIVRLMENGLGVEKIKREIDHGDVLNPGEPVAITLVLNVGSADIYVNGQLVKEASGFDFAEAVSKRPVRSLVLGNASNGDSPWRGTIWSFSAFDGALSPTEILKRFEQWGSGSRPGSGEEFIKYRLEKPAGGVVGNQAGNGWNLIIPDTLVPLHWEFLAMPSRQFLQKRHFYKDAIVNVVGFIPLGLALSIFFTQVPSEKNSWKNLLYPILAGGLLSLFIETNQVFLVSRSSYLTDLVLNILGTGIGMGIWWGKDLLLRNETRLPLTQITEDSEKSSECR